MCVRKNAAPGSPRVFALGQPGQAAERGRVTNPADQCAIDGDLVRRRQMPDVEVRTPGTVICRVAADE